MARPIEPIPVFTGKAARWFENYLKNAKPDPKKAELAKKDKEVYDQIKWVEMVEVG